MSSDKWDLIVSLVFISTDFQLSSSDLQHLASFNSPAGGLSGQWASHAGPLTAAIQAAGLDPMVSV